MSIGQIPWNKGQTQDVCQRGHTDWIIDKAGQRRCRTCKSMHNRQGRAERPKRERNSWADRTTKMGKGPREDTFSYTEIMRARGYV